MLREGRKPRVATDDKRMIDYKNEIADIKEAGLMRSLTTLDPVADAGAGLPGRCLRSSEGAFLIDFSSNDYLGLKSDSRVISAMKDGADLYGVGSGASRLITGTASAHVELEGSLAVFKGTEAALLFNSGYQANVGTIPALVARGDEIFMDRLSHASLIDGALLSRARVRRFAHCDPRALKRLLQKSTARRKLIITEGLFSMDGTVAPVAELLNLLEEFDAYLYLDEAHATGVLGRTGRGTLEEVCETSSIDRKRVIEMGTFGKALGTYGAFIAASKDIVELLVNRARSFVFSTALPAPLISATAAALRIIEEEPERTWRLKEHSVYFRTRLGRCLPGAGSALRGQESSPIVPLIVGDNARAVRLSKLLISKGFYIQAIRPPTVPEGTARLRITLSSAHSREDIDSLIETLLAVL